MNLYIALLISTILSSVISFVLFYLISKRIVKNVALKRYSIFGVRFVTGFIAMFFAEYPIVSFILSGILLYSVTQRLRKTTKKQTLLIIFSFFVINAILGILTGFVAKLMFGL